MARVLLAWELGGGLGHLQRLATVARALRAGGHQTFFAVRDLARMTEVTHPGDAGLWFQAPLWQGPHTGMRPSACYADLLPGAGFHDPAGLLGLVGGWRALFAAIQPDLLVVDHAPACLLAARGAPFATATLGTGFQLPPCVHPMPPFRTWDPPTAETLAASEAAALDTANRVLAAVQQAPLQHLHDLLRADAHWLACWPALDHYAQRPAGSAIHVGPIFADAVGQEPSWPAAPGLRCFAYLQARHGAVPAVLQALSAAPLCTLAYVAGLGSDALAQAAAPGLRLVGQPVQLASALQTADVVVCHAGMGLVSASLAAGKPLLLLPANAEQRITTSRVTAVGAGVAVDPTATAATVASAVGQLVEGAVMHTRAQAFATSLAQPLAAGAVGRVVAAAEALLAGRVAP